MSLFNKVIHVLGTRRAERVVEAFAHAISGKDRVLDIGAGGGWIGEKLKRKTKANVTLLDVADFNRTKLPLVLYDGKTIPFKDASFDATLLLYVLHHCENPTKVLKEAIRVSRGRVIILEDTFTTWFDRAFVCLHDLVANLPGVLFREPEERIFLPFHFRKTESWQEAFGKLKCRVVEARQIQSFPVKQVLFVLEKC